ncbi:XF1762 family protein [Sporosarcina sp. FSL K6-2383]|uniref:XF1762 family protein n=1 Tax=Sporosarcina sp. FSL K6-2383 TaxID=2921556 RepID=UPI003159ADBC
MAYVAVNLITGKTIAEGETVPSITRQLTDEQASGETYIGKRIELVPTVKNPDFFWIFMKESTTEYMAFPETQMTEELRWQLEGQGYDLIADSVLKGTVDTYMKEMYPCSEKLYYKVKPISFKSAKEFVTKHHRHHKAPQGHKYSIALTDGDSVIGVAIAGRPVSRHLDDGITIEVTRCCVLPGFKNAVSKLYAAIVNAAKAMGYSKVITYTLCEENGVSMKGAGFKREARSPGGTWDSHSRPRIDKHPTVPKYRWSKVLN